MNGITVREQLEALAEPGYQKFASSLIPNIDNLMGVRLPALRRIAIAAARGDWRAWLEDVGSEAFEEIMLQAMVMGYAEMNLEERLRYVADFVPKIDNWSVCDRFCLGMKFARDNQAPVWAFIQPYLKSAREYDIRFGVVMMLEHFIDDVYVDDMLKLLDEVSHEGYYVKMAVAWAVSMCYVKFPERTETYLAECALDDFTFNKSLQKIVESYRVDADAKQRIRGMRRSVRGRREAADVKGTSEPRA
ncbi:3-methyladenine DNA glycosylase AlkD [Cohnella sp. OV330]|uniref:DNA alkylation repair protein n=1 Tax=Cohnella sp. OV330 TaxID=1855288 RepID=UPI0008F08325|nr:DNA alkylation repair protein [Cohnella sp. OV330]SFB29063.1 3-methyladenine DNA glycosylase AlkD [Cohnella sp. OV330]